MRIWKTKKIISLVLIIWSIILLNEVYAQKARTGGIQFKDNFFKDKTKISDPFSLRDPFKIPNGLGSSRDESDRKTSLIEGVFTNLPTIEEVPLGEIRIVGVLVGKERRAIAVLRGGGKGDTVVLKEGMFLGRDNAEIKAIMPGGIVLVEKIINVYGQEEYLETVLPIEGKSNQNQGNNPGNNNNNNNNNDNNNDNNENGPE